MNRLAWPTGLFRLTILCLSTILGVASTAIADEAESSSIKSDLLEQLDAEFAEGRHGYIDALLVLHDGKLIKQSRYRRDYVTPFQTIEADPEAARFWGKGNGDYYYVDPAWHPWLRGGDLHTAQSVTKSVTSALIGIAILRGEIESVDMAVAPLLDSAAPFKGDPRAKKLTLRHFLTMTTGIAWNESDYLDDQNDAILMELSPNWQQYVLDRPFSDEPGSVFNYNSGTSALLDVVLFKTTGMHADEYAQEHLFKPLGIKTYHWKSSPNGFSDTQGGLYLSAQDLARIGTLYANDGIWEGKRILPDGWVRDSFAPAISVGSEPGWKYGYQWWLIPDPGNPGKLVPMALGYGGQKLAILTEEKVVAVLYGWNIFEGTAEYSSTDFLGHLVGTFRSPAE